MNSFISNCFCAIILASMIILPFTHLKADIPQGQGQQSQQGQRNQSQQNWNAQNQQNWNGGAGGWFGDEPNPYHNYYNAFPQEDFNNTKETPQYNPFPQEDFANTPQF